MNPGSRTLALQGVTCANCVLRIERHLADLPGVKLARGNATQKRLRLVWDEGRQSIDGLKQKISDLGYEAIEIAESDDAAPDVSLLPRLAVAALGSMNIMAFSVSVWFGQATDMGPGTMQFLHWLSAAIALPVMIYSGAVFHRPALRALRAGHMTMDTPITLAIWITFAGSLFETIRRTDDVYFDAVVALIFFLLIGRVLEQAMRRRSENAADNLRALMRVEAARIGPSGDVTIVAASALCPGDRVQVQTGMQVPADGTMQSPSGEFDESVLTGESRPRRRVCGEKVAAGAIVTLGPVELAVRQVGEASELGQVARMIDDVSGHKGKLQRLSDRFARGYIPLVLIGGSLGFLLWFFVFDASFAEALQIAIAVLIVTCPCAAGLATPAVTSRAANLAMQGGIVVKSADALETLAGTDLIVLDKTGTATVPAVAPCVEIDPDNLRAAQALAAGSRHPLARALTEGRGVPLLDGVIEHQNLGMEGPDGSRLGSAAFVGLDESDAAPGVLYFKPAGGKVLKIPLAEKARPELAEFLAGAKRMKIKVSLHSGDTALSVGEFAQSSGIDTWHANQRPGDKLGYVRNAQSGGAQVLMVGDGVNDAVALSGADVSVSFAGATDIAQSAADIVLTRPDLSLIPKAIRHARSARNLVAQGLAFATLYNLVTVPLALAGYLTPAIAAFLMSSSSIIVLANGFRLKPLS